MSEPTEPPRIRVVVVDDHAAMRGVITMTLDAEDDMEVVGEAADGEAALRVCAQTHPDVVLTDLQLPRLDGVATVRALQRCDPLPKVLVLTAGTDERQIADALAAGASGCVLKMAGIDELLAAIRATHTRPATARQN